MESIIRHRATGDIITRGAGDVRAVLEDAIARGAVLDGADLRGANLSCAALDGARLRHVNMADANLTGANLSEAQLEECHMRGVVMHGACLCESALTRCDISGAVFGGTDVAGARFVNCAFSTLSALQMDFVSCAAIEDCLFHDEVTGVAALFAEPPVHVTGLEMPVTIMDTHVRIGTQMIARSVWMAMANDNWPGARGQRPDGRIYHFVRRHAALLRAVGGGGRI